MNIKINVKKDQIEFSIVSKAQLTSGSDRQPRRTVPQHWKNGNIKYKKKLHSLINRVALMAVVGAAPPPGVSFVTICHGRAVSTPERLSVGTAKLDAGP